MHCRGAAGGGRGLREGEMEAEEVRQEGWKLSERLQGGKGEGLTLYDVDTFPLRRVFLGVVGRSEIPSVGLLYPGPTLPSGCHTRVVLYWKHRQTVYRQINRQADESV